MSEPNKFVRAFLHPQVLYFVVFLVPIAGIYYFAPRPTKPELESQLRSELKDTDKYIAQQSINQIKNLYQTGNNWNFKQVTDPNEGKRGTMNTATHPAFLRAQQQYAKHWTTENTPQSESKHNVSNENQTQTAQVPQNTK